MDLIHLYISILVAKLTCWPSCKIQQIQSAIKHFITKAHKCQNVFLIIQTHYEILIWIKEFVRSFSL